MYQDAVGGGGGGVVEEGEAAEYHIMYGHYDPLAPPTPQATATTTLKMGQGGAKDGTLTGVTLAGGGALVPAADLVDVPALSDSPPCGAGGDGALTVTTEELGVAGPGHSSPVAVGGMEAAAAALVTSMVAPGECESGGGGSSRKVIVKLFNSNTFSLDIITDGDGEGAVAPHHMLARGGATLVHAKLAAGSIIPAQGQRGAGDSEEGELAAPPAHAPHQATQEEEGAAAEAAALPCRVMWTCAYCSVMLATSEAMAAHQQVCAKALGDLPPLHTTTSQATVDALMSPLRPQEEPSYHLKLEAATEGPESAAAATTTTTTTTGEGSGTAEVVAVWVCAVCEEEFPHPRALGRHLPSHSVHQLAAALLQLATPCQRVRPAVVVTVPDTATTSTTTTTTTTTTPTSPDPLSIVAVDSPAWPSDHPDIKLEEESVDNPGDTPPQTPPQDKPLARRARRRPGPRPQDRPERKRKYTRRKKEEEEAVVEENEVESQGKEYRSITTATVITTVATTTTTTTTSQGAPSGPSSSSSSIGGRGSRDPHHCEVCNKKLSSRGNLAKHLIRHRAKKPFECTLCHATFNAKRDCRNHYLQHHTTERPNRCHICGKSYVDKSYLLAHMVFHRDQKAYACELCGKKFNTSRCVTRHKKRHQEEKRFVCDICFRPFAVKGDLTSHKRKVHSKQTQGAGTARAQHQQQQQQQLLPSQQQTQTHLPIQTQQPPTQPHQETQHQGKTKDLTEFILPEVVASPHILPDQLLPSDLSGGSSLGGTVTSKGGIFISGDPLAVSSLITGGEGDNGGGGCSYGVTLAPAAGGGPGRGDVVGGEGQPAYIMINSGGSSAEKGVATTTAGLSIMYTSSPTLTQQVGDLDDIQQLSTSVGPSLVGGEGQLDLEGHLEDQHHSQDHGTATLTAGDGGMSTTHRGDLGLGDSEGGPGGMLVGGEDSHNPPSTHDPNSGFPLELISQTYQLDLQRNQSTASYLG